MVSISWCLKQKHGLELVKPNSNMSESYLGMAEESITVLNKVTDSSIWSATTSYYIFYYSLYALMLKIGIKCEIHTCSIEFLEKCLSDYYEKQDIDMFKKAFSARQDLQYYANRAVDQRDIDLILRYCKTFFIKTKEIIANMSEQEIMNIRSNLK